MKDDISFEERLGFLMDQLMDILSEVNGEVDFETCDTLMDDNILDSYEIDSIVEEVNDAFGVDITSSDVTPENFNSAEAIWDLIQQLKNN